MGEPIKILDLAKKMIYLSGMTPIDKMHSDGDIAIKFTGLRPGEKLYEELLIGNSSEKTEHSRIMKAKELSISFDLVLEGLNEFKEACKKQDSKRVIELLEKYVHDYNRFKN